MKPKKTNKPNKAHDKLFKRVLKTFLAEFMDLFFPVCSESIDWNSMEPMDKEIIVTDLKQGDRNYLDLVFKVKSRTDGTYILIHIEPQAYEQSEFSKRMCKYHSRLYEEYDLPVYPIAIFSFENPVEVQSQAHELRVVDLHVLSFNYRVVQLNQLDWRDYLKYENPVAAAFMARMRIATEDRPEVKLVCLTLLQRLKLNLAQKHVIAEFVDIYLDLTAAEIIVYEKLFDELGGPVKEGVIAMVTSWERKGIEKGREEGRQEGKFGIVIKLLIRRLGRIDSITTEQIRELNSEQLDSLSEALLDFSGADDLKKWWDENNKK